MSFELDARLAEDTAPIGDLALCRVALMNDRRYPWLILVPRRANIIELTDLEAADRLILMDEIAAAVSYVRRRRDVDKTNVGALGNIVRQLHIHVVGRRIGDAAWPGPVWGHGVAQRYDDAARTRLATEARDWLKAT